VADGVALALALVALAACLGAAVARPRWLPEAVAAGVGAGVLLASGAISPSAAGHALRTIGPTVGFLAALLALAEGCRVFGVFDAVGAGLVGGARGRPRRLLAGVFAVACAVTIVLGLDATVVLVTPVVLVCVRRLRTDVRPHAYACVHLANSASLLLPVSNLTNLLAFRASGLSFARFAALMALPTVAVVVVEWVVLARWAPGGVRRAVGSGVAGGEVGPGPSPPLPRYPLGVLAATLAGFAFSSAISVAPVWIAVAGAVAMTAPLLASGRASVRSAVRSLQPGFLVFVLLLAVIVAAAGEHGLTSLVRDLLPGAAGGAGGAGLGALLLTAAIAAVLANVVNNLPATLLLVPVAAPLGVGSMLAVLIGVNVGPNLTEAGSLATLLWRRVLAGEGVVLARREFAVLGAMTVPAGLVAATVLLWVALRA
jgi:arsenical pump membrane protein